MVNIYLNITCTVPHVSAFKSHKVGSREDPALHYFVISFSVSYLLPGLFLIGFSTGFSSPLTSIYVTEACISIIVPQNRQMSLLPPDLNNFELVVLQVIVKVAGTGNKGIVTSVFNCQLTSGLLFINMVYIIFKMFINNGESTWYKFWKLLQNVARIYYILKMIAQAINFL